MARFDPVTLRKRCPRCRRELRLVAFNRSRAMPDGYSGWCRRCTRAAQTRWWLANLERYAEWNRRRRAAYVHVLARDREKVCARCGQPFIAPAGMKRWTCDPCQRVAARRTSQRWRDRHAADQPLTLTSRSATMSRQALPGGGAAVRFRTTRAGRRFERVHELNRR